MNVHRSRRSIYLGLPRRASFPHLFLAIAVLLVGNLSVSSAAYLAEVSFDDAEDQSQQPELNNMETDSGVRVRLTGVAYRSALDEGRYGRAANFPGGQGAIELAPFVPANELAVLAWIAVRDRSKGSLVAQPGSWALHLKQGEIVLRLTPPSGPPVVVASGVHWPVDDQFHHLSVVVQSLNGVPRFTLTVDFTAPAMVIATVDPADVMAPLRLADGLDGMVDELIVSNRSAAFISAEQEAFNRDPAACIPGATCGEQLFLMTPRKFTHPIPVRYKFVYDSNVCSAATPCPLLFAINGGSACANDYTLPSDLSAMVALGFLVVTIDPYCEGNGNTFVPDTEVDQFITTKNLVLNHPRLSPLLASSEYFATGCSHGAQAVTEWTIFEVDHPSRTYVRSGSNVGACSLFAGKLCAAQAGQSKLPDVESAEFEARQLRTDAVLALTKEVARSRQFSASWGINLEGPICGNDGKALCKEEGEWAMTYGSRRLRDAWEAYEDKDQPSGYFVEDSSADCQHCAPPESRAFRCGMCMVRWGREQMSGQCPECLSYSVPSISHGGAAELCPLNASWYLDPIQSPDAGVDVAEMATGCSYGSLPTASMNPFAWMLVLGLGGRRLRHSRQQKPLPPET